MSFVEQVIDELRAHILTTYLPGERPEALTMSTPLITGGILDSLSVLETIAFLEQRLNVEFEAHEVSRNRMDTLSGIAEVIREKVPG